MILNGGDVYWSIYLFTLWLYAIRPRNVTTSNTSSKALITALLEPQNYENISQSVSSILFFGTPHKGSTQTNTPFIVGALSNLALGTTQVSRFTGRFRNDLIEFLERDS